MASPITIPYVKCDAFAPLFYVEDNEIYLSCSTMTVKIAQSIFIIWLKLIVQKIYPLSPQKSQKKELYIISVRWDGHGQVLIGNFCLSSSQFYWELWYPYCYICNSWRKRRSIYQAAPIIFFVCPRHWELCKGHWKW